MVIYGDVWVWRDVAEVTRDRSTTSPSPCRHGVGEELRALQHVEVHENAAQIVGEEVRAQQFVGVNDVVPSLADAAAPADQTLPRASPRLAPAPGSSVVASYRSVSASVNLVQADLFGFGSVK